MCKGDELFVKGDIAKKTVKEKIIAALGNDYIGEYDKKLYTWMDDGGERIQVAIALTCPKVFKEDNVLNNSSSAGTPEITPKEMENLETLMKKFGL